MTNLDYKYIRQLIKKFFDGDSSPEEERVLFDLFNNNKKEELPLSLQTDYDLFIALSYYNVEPPKDIVEEVDNEVSREVAKPKRNIKGIIFLAGVAAIFLVAVLLLPDWTISDSSNPSIYSEPMASELVSPENENPISTESGSQKEPIAAVAVEKPDMQAKPKLRHKKVKNNETFIVEDKPVETEIDISYLEIENVEEASVILENVELKLSKALSKGFESQQKIHDMENLLSSTIKKINSI